MHSMHQIPFNIAGACAGSPMRPGPVFILRPALTLIQKARHVGGVSPSEPLFRASRLRATPASAVSIALPRR